MAPHCFLTIDKVTWPSETCLGHPARHVAGEAPFAEHNKADDTLFIQEQSSHGS